MLVICKALGMPCVHMWNFQIFMLKLIMATDMNLMEMIMVTVTKKHMEAAMVNRMVMLKLNNTMLIMDMPNLRLMHPNRMHMPNLRLMVTVTKIKSMKVTDLIMGMATTVQSRLTLNQYQKING